MPVPTKSFAQFVDDMITVWAASVGVSPSFGSGDVLLAMMQAVGTQDEFLLAQILRVAALTRAATSNGSDLDSWVQQFGMARLPGSVASGTVTFSKNGLANAAIQIPVGTQVQSADGLVQYVVVADTAQPGYDAALGAYVLAAGQSSVTATATCTVEGTAGNVIVGQISQVTVNLPGIDAVTNAAAIENGKDAETDAALRARIPGYFASLRTAVAAAILFAAKSVQQGTRFQLISALPQVGFYTLYADDGSGDAPDSFISAVTAAVQAVTAEGVTPVVMRPTISTATVAASLQVAAGVTRSVVVANAAAALSAYGATLPIGAGLSYPRLSAIIFGSDPNITDVLSVTLNGAESSLPGVQGQLIEISPAVS